jgi:integrase
MAILAECPKCHSKQSIKNKICIKCGINMDGQKEQKKVRYHIVGRIDGRQKWWSLSSFEGVDPYSLEDAKDVEAKLRVNKREGKLEVFKVRKETTITFKELTTWFLDLVSIKKLASYDRVMGVIENFNKEFGDKPVSSIKPIDLENYQDLREEQGAKPATIDMEIGRVNSMIRKAFDNDKINGDALKAFKRVKKKLKKGSNTRKRLLRPQEYLKLLTVSHSHLKPILVVAYNTGMRKGELRKLQWRHVDKKAMFLRLTGDITKTGESRDIPINHHVKTVLDALPRAINHNFVFTYQGKPFTHKTAFRAAFKTACSDTEIPYGRKEANGITFHDIRRTVKTNMLNSGVDKAHRDMIIGHSLQGMDVHYLIPTEDSLKEAMDRYTQWLDGRLLDKKEGVRQNVR